MVEVDAIDGDRSVSLKQFPAAPSCVDAVPALKLEGVSMSFPVKQGGSRAAFSDIHLEVPEKGFVSIVGPSGCGKSTVLNVCAGTLVPTSGRIEFFGKAITGFSRDVGYITQDANLLPWLTTTQNVELPLKLAGVRKRERAARAAEWLNRVGLWEFAQSYPQQLSGGMQKRCSLARTLVYEPKIVLMDEPFGALDAMTKLVMQQELMDLWERDRKTVLFVTHDLAEAISLSDSIVVMSRGPGRIKEVVSVDIPRPRDIGQINGADGFVDLFEHLWNAFKEEL